MIRAKNVKARADAIGLYRAGVSVVKIAESVGVSRTTVCKWIKQDRVIRPISLQPPTTQIRPMTLDEFIYMLSKMTSSYNEMKADMAEMRKSAEEWKCMAGRLNQQLQSAFQDK